MPHLSPPHKKAMRLEIFFPAMRCPMRRVLLALPILACVFMIYGCGSNRAKAESLAKETIDLMNEMSSIIEKAPNAKDAKPQLESFPKKFKELEQRAKELKLSKSDDAELEKKMLPELEKAKARLISAVTSLATKDPAGVMDI